MKNSFLASLLLVNFHLGAALEKQQPSSKKAKSAKRVLAKKPTPTAGVVALTQSNYKETLTHKLVIVMATAEWCAYCRKMKPVFDESSSTVVRSTDDQVTYATLSLGDYFGDPNSLVPRLQTEYGIKEQIDGIPSFLIFRDGKFVEMVKGTQSKEQLATFVKKYS